MFTKAIALAFFTSVVDASNIMSNNVINPAKLREMVQSLSSKWSEQYVRSYNRRHLQNDAACTWVPQVSQCTVVSSLAKWIMDELMIAHGRQRGHVISWMEDVKLMFVCMLYIYIWLRGC